MIIAFGNLIDDFGLQNNLGEIQRTILYLRRLFEWLVELGGVYEWDTFRIDSSEDVVQEVNFACLWGKIQIKIDIETTLEVLPHAMVRNRWLNILKA